MPETKSKFIKVSCSKCKNEQIIFNRSNKLVKCLVCENPLTERKKGKIVISSNIIQNMD